MSKLSIFIIALDLLFGAGAFAALFRADVDISLRIFLGLAYSHIAFLIEAKFTEHADGAQTVFQWIVAALSAIELRLNGQEVTIEETLAAKNKELDLTEAIGALRFAAMIMTASRLAIWIGVGFAISKAI